MTHRRHRSGSDLNTKERFIMTIVRYNPSTRLAPRRVDLLSQVNKELDQIFNQVFNGHYFADKKSKGYPLMDVIRKDDSLICQFTVPGVQLEDISLDITDEESGRYLSISGKLSSEYSDFSSDEYQIKELSSQEFRRVLRLPDDVSDEEPLAVLRNGILTLTFGLVKAVSNAPEAKKIKILQG